MRRRRDRGGLCSEHRARVRRGWRGQRLSPRLVLKKTLNTKQWMHTLSCSQQHGGSVRPLEPENGPHRQDARGDGIDGEHTGEVATNRVHVEGSQHRFQMLVAPALS